jgi:hypothetical protein
MENHINIVYYKEVVDNWGRTESSRKGRIIFDVFHNVEDWTDDMIFEDNRGNLYHINDLVGKLVNVQDVGIFRVPIDENK